MGRRISFRREMVKKKALFQGAKKWKDRRDETRNIKNLSRFMEQPIALLLLLELALYSDSRDALESGSSIVCMLYTCAYV